MKTSVPSFDERQERVLLGLVEAVHLVEEEHGGPSRDRPLLPGRLDDLPNVLHAGEHRGQRLEPRIAGRGHDAGQRRLARAGRAPEDHRVRRAGLDQARQRTPVTQEVALPDHLGQGLGPHAVGERSPRVLLGVEGQRFLRRAHPGIVNAKGIALSAAGGHPATARPGPPSRRARHSWPPGPGRRLSGWRRCPPGQRAASP